MAPLVLSSLLRTALFFALQPKSVYANAIASWWIETNTNTAPQLFQYNATTNTIHASLCNSLGETPIYARNASTALETTITPLANTAIASVGYLSDSSNSTLESTVFYLAALDNDDGTTTAIAAAPYTCNSTSGHWTPSAPPAFISNGTTSCGTAPAIDPAGGLAAMYLNEADGIRVLFKTASTLQTHYLQYLPTSPTDTSSCTITGWSYAGAASQLTTGRQLAISFLPSTPKVWSLAQTVLANSSLSSADSSGQIEFSTSNAGGVADLWSINRMPTQVIADNGSTTHGVLSNMSTADADAAWQFEATDSWGFVLSAFSGAMSRIGVATASSGVPSVFYLGTDGGLRRFDADELGHWHATSSKDDTKWPVADVIMAGDDSDAYADFGLAYDATGNRIWMFYEVDGQMTQVYQSATSTWQDYQTLVKYNASLAATSSPTGESSGSESSSAESSGLASSSGSSTSLVGLGVGLGLGIPLACSAIALIYFLRRRRQRRRGAPACLPSEKHDRNSAISPMTEASGSTIGPSQNQGYWQDGVWVEKTRTEYYANGAGPGARSGRQRLGELDIARSQGPAYELGSEGCVKYELPHVGERRVGERRVELQ